MINENIKEMVLYSLQKHFNNSGLATYVIKYWVNADFKKNISTNKILYVLKKLEKKELVERVPSAYKTMISWKIIK